jgi:hypothetical protein
MIYPHDLRQGEHGFHVESCLGTAVLVRPPASADDSTRYVVDLNSLKGRRLHLGDFTSPRIASQPALF